MLKKIIEGFKRPVTLIAILYVVLGSLWILFSDKLVLMFFSDPVSITQVQSYKGWFYVLASGFLIYVLMSWLVIDLRNKERDLQSYEQQQKSFLNNHYQPLWKSDKMGNCFFTNDKWFDFAGYDIIEDKPFAWLNRVHPHDKPYCIDKFTYGFISKNTFELEYRLQVKSNEYHWVHNTCVPYYDALDEFQGFLGFYTDIQEKKQLQERYKDSSMRYGYLFANNPNPMLVYDLQDLRILEANRAALLLYGYTDQEFLAMSIIDLRPASEIPLLMDHISESLPVFHRSSGWIHKRKDGSLFDAEVTAHSLPQTNNRTMRMVIIRDITDQIKAFRSVKEGDRRFRAIFEQSPQGAVICNSDLVITDINPAACSMLDVPKNKALEMSLFDFLNIVNHPFSLENAEKIRQGVSSSGEVSMKRLPGVSFRAGFSSIKFVENGLQKIYFTFCDIDEKHKMQKALEESERINSTLVSNLPGMVYRCRNDESWTMIYVSFGVEKLTGYLPSELLENNLVSYENIIHAEDRAELRKIVSEGIDRKEKYETQYRIICKDEKIKWVWEQAQGVFDEKGELDFVEGFIMDITKEKESQQQAEFQSFFLGLIIDNIPFPLFYKDDNGLYTGCNASFCEYLGKEKQEIIGRSLFDIFEKEQALVFYEKDRELMEKGGKQTYETTIVFPDERKMDAVFHKSVFFSEGDDTRGIIGIYFDISARVEAERVIQKQMAELERINGELERFAYTVSHDLRSPLVTIKGFLNLLKEDLVEGNHSQIDQDMYCIENATDKMHQLLEDLLTYTRVGRLPQLQEEISMSQIAHEAHELLFGLLQGSNVKVEISENMPVVKGGKARIRELYQNLMENALKFSAMHPNPTVKLYCRHENNQDVFCVEDNGIGISPEHHQKVFDLFTKLENNNSGTGIGLSLVKRIVEIHHGRIWIESDGKNNGATFCFTLHTENKQT
jgi:PAS domain S-box-containing protein